MPTMLEAPPELNVPKTVISSSDERLVLVKIGSDSTSRRPLYETVIEFRTVDAMGGPVWKEQSRFNDGHPITKMAVAEVRRLQEKGP